MPEEGVSYVGQRVPRLDSEEKVTGRAIYGVDVDLPGMLYGAVLRSSVPHAKITGIDTTEAQKVPGVRVVVTGKDFPYTFGNIIKDQPFIAIDRVRYVGDPVAAVAAETEAQAHEALEKIHVQYEALEAVFDPRDAMADGAPILHPDFETYPQSIPSSHVAGTNICVTRNYRLGDVDRGFAHSDEIFEDEFSAQALSHVTMEPFAAVAQYEPLSGEYTLWSSNDRPYSLHKELATALNVSDDKIRIIVPYVGGSFGGKNSLKAEAFSVALAKYTKGRPVKVVFSREESITASLTRLAAFLKLKTGVKRDGTLIARSADIVWDNGAYTNIAPGVANRGCLTIFGPYRIPNLSLISKLVYTNNEITGSYRGFGTTQVTWACEIQMDIIAKKLGIDPLSIRLKNGYVKGDSYINGQTMHHVRLIDTIEKAGKAIAWGKKPDKASQHKRRGKGIATMLKGTATPTDNFCFIKLGKDGKITVFNSSPEIGAGQKTVLAQIAADAIGVPLSSVSITDPDTRVTPFNAGVSSSRTTFHMGKAIQMAAREVQTKILEFAAQILETDTSKLMIKGGKIFENGVVERATLSDMLSKKFRGKSGAVLGEGFYTPDGDPQLSSLPGLEKMSSIFWMFATQAAEVEVDIETGVVKVLKVVSAHDVGKAINPMSCEQQIEGSVITGLSNALFEEFKKDKGRILNDSLSDYKVATMEDIPEIVPILIEDESNKDPVSLVKGVGEPATAPIAPAISNAIYDAVGIRIKDLPITPDKVLAALKAKKEGKESPDS